MLITGHAGETIMLCRACIVVYDNLGRMFRAGPEQRFPEKGDKV